MGFRADQTIILTGVRSRELYPEALRRVSYVDPETNKRFVFLTNIFTIPANTVANIYKQRWQIELFFKWIKQHLKVKSLFGTSFNTVKPQIWVAISIYLLAAIMKKRLNLPGSLHTILQILEVNIFEKKPSSGLSGLGYRLKTVSFCNLQPKCLHPIYLNNYITPLLFYRHNPL